VFHFEAVKSTKQTFFVR